ncbi:MAG: hypothetical protein U1F87_09390 [Kiritimatiellia bacterium]
MAPPLALCAQWAAAQDNPAPPPPGDRPSRPRLPAKRGGNGQGPSHRPSAEGAIREWPCKNATNAPGQGSRMLMERPDGQMAAPFEGVRRYMAKLKEENPEKYEKLMKLQQENPASLHPSGHMTREIMKKKLEGFPKVHPRGHREAPEERRMGAGCRFLGFQGMGPRIQRARANAGAGAACRSAWKAARPLPQGPRRPGPRTSAPPPRMS